MPKSEAAFADVFQSLRRVLQKHAVTLVVREDTPMKYCLEAAVGPATLHAWGGKARKPRIPVAWVEVGKSYVIDGPVDPGLQNGWLYYVK